MLRKFFANIGVEKVLKWLVLNHWVLETEAAAISSFLKGVFYSYLQLHGVETKVDQPAVKSKPLFSVFSNIRQNGYQGRRKS